MADNTQEYLVLIDDPVLGSRYETRPAPATDAPKPQTNNNATLNKIYAAKTRTITQKSK